jgi:hypothetical protein
MMRRLLSTVCVAMAVALLAPDRGWGQLINDPSDRE